MDRLVANRETAGFSGPIAHYFDVPLCWDRVPARIGWPKPGLHQYETKFRKPLPLFNKVMAAGQQVRGLSALTSYRSKQALSQIFRTFALKGSLDSKTKMRTSSNGGLVYLLVHYWTAFALNRLWLGQKNCCCLRSIAGTTKKDAPQGLGSIHRNYQIDWIVFAN